MATDRFFFHSKSAPAAPGKGVHEEAAHEYPTLVANPHWRRALSNFWVTPFQFTDGYRYNSVEHCFQAQKIAIPYGPRRSLGPEIPFRDSLAFQFTMNSLSELGLGDGAAAQKQRKMTVLSRDELAYWDTVKEEVMAQAQFAKFSQCGTLRHVLLGTGHAALWHAAARQKPARMWSLERVRDALRAGATALPPEGEDTDSEAEAEN